MTERIVLIGAGSVVFTRGLIADIIRFGWKAELVLVDTDPKALKIILELGNKMILRQNAKIKLSGTIDRKKALKGATVVVTTIGVGGRRAWEKDVFIPRKYGIYQPVGDSVLPGGTSRALRMIDAMVAISNDVLDICPDALFFNYSNPMSVICRAVRKATGTKIAGLCHGVPQSAAALAETLGVNVSELRYTAVGMNHLTWFTSVKVGNVDAFPRMRDIASGAFGIKLLPAKKPRFWTAGIAEKNGVRSDIRDVFCWQLFKEFGAYPVPGDRHVCEFFGRMFTGKGGYFGRTLGVDAYSFEDVIKWGDETFKEHARLAAERRQLPNEFMESISGEHEQVIDIIESIRRDSGKTFSANLENNGQVENIARGAVIEAPAIADHNGMRPVHIGLIPEGVAGTLATRFQWAETVVEAALTGSRDKFVQALILDGAVKDPDQAVKLADELLEAQAKYLPKFR